ncbi:unnamed protein product [Cyprideis torosa]|uniref:Uncharacterized protein n=1 Tax=Cyprideis torosa TaxID=163714 RepID=A0A7R8ZPV2_9CRUS|nr:unnamed protein product [Cyprideis torosa]CAG0899795.1 unnamed protein product [Cyprideis torosa]
MLRSLCPMIDQYRVILASSSPRRKEIMGLLGVKYEVVPSSFVEEDLISSSFATVSDFVLTTSRGKAKEVFMRLACEKTTSDETLLVIGADTSVSVSTGTEDVMGKPKTPEKAVEMLKKLRDMKRHFVFTGVSIWHGEASDPKVHEFTCATEVDFSSKAMTDEAINAYVATGEPLDKAGGYGVQGLGGAFVEGIRGDFYNVIGLPFNKLHEALVTIVEEDKGTAL